MARLLQAILMTPNLSNIFVFFLCVMLTGALFCHFLYCFCYFFYLFHFNRIHKQSF